MHDDRLAHRLDRHDRDDGFGDRPAVAPGRRTLTASLGPARRRIASGTRPPTGARELELGAGPALDLATIQRRPIGRVGEGGGGEGGGGEGGGPAAPSGGGRALPEDVRAKMEASFGADLSAVRVHEGPHVTAAGALAYARGQEVHFAPGQYDPHSAAGQELLGHELAHVVQQAQGRVAATAQAKGLAINDDPALEREADEMGARAARGEPAGAAAVSMSGSRTSAAQRIPIKYAVGNKTRSFETDELMIHDLVVEYLNMKKAVPGELGPLVAELVLRLAAISSGEIVEAAKAGKFFNVTKLAAELAPGAEEVIAQRLLAWADGRDAPACLERLGPAGGFILAKVLDGRKAEGDAAKAGLLRGGSKKVADDRSSVENGQRAGEIRRAFIAYCDQALRFCHMIRGLVGCTPEMLGLAIQALDLLIGGADKALLDDAATVKHFDAQIAPLQDRNLTAEVSLYRKVSALFLGIVGMMQDGGQIQGSALAAESRGPQAWEHGMAQRRAAVDQCLAPTASVVQASLPGACLKYRGSLPNRLRSFKKSKDGVAQRMDLGHFDVDAFVEVPDAVWSTWVELGFITGPEQSKGKLHLPTLIHHVQNPRPGSRDQAEALAPRLLAIEGQCAPVKGGLGEIDGYKHTDGGDVDFFFVIQPASKSEKEVAFGNPYPLGEVAAAGMPLTELLHAHDRCSEFGNRLVMAVFMPETHVTVAPDE